MNLNGNVLCNVGCAIFHLKVKYVRKGPAGYKLLNGNVHTLNVYFGMRCNVSMIENYVVMNELV